MMGAAEKITHVKAGGPPANWSTLTVYDLVNEMFVRDVIECDTVEGWVVVYQRNQFGNLIRIGDEAATSTIAGRFAIRQKQNCR